MNYLFATAKFSSKSTPNIIQSECIYYGTGMTKFKWDNVETPCVPTTSASCRDTGSSGQRKIMVGMQSGEIVKQQRSDHL